MSDTKHTPQVAKLTKDMRLLVADMAKHPGRSGDWWVRFGEYSAQTLAGLRRRNLIVEDRYTGTLARSTWRLNDAGNALLKSIESDDIETRLAHLDEIADGAWGDNPMMRGKARDEAARLRSGKTP